MSVTQRWWLLGGALVVAVAIGFVVGSAVKSTSAPAPAGTLATGGAGAVSHVSVTRVGAVAPVPALRRRATHRAASTSSSASATGTTAATSTIAATTTVAATSTTPPPSTATHTTATVVSTTTGGGGGGGGG